MRIPPTDAMTGHAATLGDVPALIEDVADGVTLHVGDCRDVLPTLDLDPATTVAITDPPWPNSPARILATWRVTGVSELLEETFALLATRVRRMIVVLGCASDPRCLVVPTTLPSVRVCWLRHVVPSYAGTILNSGDVAYVFGSHEGPEGKTVLPGEVSQNNSRIGARDRLGHPSPRREEHMRWLVTNFTRSTDTVLDPFVGSGTTLLAARDAGRRSIGIEKHAPYVDAIRSRFDQQTLLRVAE